MSEVEAWITFGIGAAMLLLALWTLRISKSEASSALEMLNKSEQHLKDVRELLRKKNPNA